MTMNCFHCHLPIAGEPQMFIKVEGAKHPMCCPGCLAVASLIHDIQRKHPTGSKANRKKGAGSPQPKLMKTNT